MEIKVNLAKRSYPIHLVHDEFKAFPSMVKQRFDNTTIALVTNTTIADLYRKVIAQWQEEMGFYLLVIQDGEQFKSVDTWNSVIDFLIRSGLDRKSVVCALGGGVIGDLVGFAASAVLRGISFVQIPTTLLAMVDSSVGGKTGVNHALGKNLIGAFHQPSFVYLDSKFLDTLPDREFVAGYGELFKYAFIGGRGMFDFVNKNNDGMLTKQKDVLLEGIRRSVEIKARVVEADEREENGLRAMLNFGHTFGHALERFYRYEHVLHGEAVIFGIKCACNLGMRLHTIPQEFRREYDGILAKCPTINLPQTIQRPNAEILYKAMFTDKKTIGGKLHFVVPTVPGESVLRRDIPQEPVWAAITENVG